MIFCYALLLSATLISVTGPLIEALPILSAQMWDPLTSRKRIASTPGIGKNYYPDGKWPAYGWDAPANYHNYGKLNDVWSIPRNIPRWYEQPESTLFVGTAGFLKPDFYFYPVDPFYYIITPRGI